MYVKNLKQISNSKLFFLIIFIVFVGCLIKYFLIWIKTKRNEWWKVDSDTDSFIPAHRKKHNNLNKLSTHTCTHIHMHAHTHIRRQVGSRITGYNKITASWEKTGTNEYCLSPWCSWAGYSIGKGWYISEDSLAISFCFTLTVLRPRNIKKWLARWLKRTRLNVWRTEFWVHDRFP